MTSGVEEGRTPAIPVAGVRPKLLDLFCCEGGASVGYHRAGFDVYGVDLFRHRNDDDKLVGYRRQRYPFPALQSDALTALERTHHVT